MLQRQILERLKSSVMQKQLLLQLRACHHQAQKRRWLSPLLLKPQLTTTETETAAPVVTEEVVKKVADPKVQKKAAAPLAPSPDDTEDDLRTKYEARAKLFQEILGEDEAGARNKGMDLAMIGLAIMSGQSPNCSDQHCSRRRSRPESYERTGRSCAGTAASYSDHGP